MGPRGTRRGPRRAQLVGELEAEDHQPHDFGAAPESPRGARSSASDVAEVSDHPIVAAVDGNLRPARRSSSASPRTKHDSRRSSRTPPRSTRTRSGWAAGRPWLPLKINLGDVFCIHTVHVQRHLGQIERVIATLSTRSSRDAAGSAIAPMEMTRREFVLATITAVATGCGVPRLPTSRETRTMYGLIGRMTATPGQRDRLAAILLEGTTAMPGCLSYIVALGSDRPRRVVGHRGLGQRREPPRFAPAPRSAGGDSEGAPAHRRLRLTDRDDTARRCWARGGRATVAVDTRSRYF
jgi:hypothetical protein